MKPLQTQCTCVFWSLNMSGVCWKSTKKFNSIEDKERPRMFVFCSRLIFDFKTWFFLKCDQHITNQLKEKFI